MSARDDRAVRDVVERHYEAIARAAGGGCCAPATSGCCGAPQAADHAAALGYSKEELQGVPEGADLQLGCGNPHLPAMIRPGETVVDLGSGAGFDCFIAARSVGPSGRVIGVDMTEAMVARAEELRKKQGFPQVSFRMGLIEALPVEDGVADVVISNCVVNLSPDKPAVFREAFRVLKPGGRLAISDVVLRAELPPEMRDDPGLLAGCIAGARPWRELERQLTDAGFEEVRIREKADSERIISGWMPGMKLEEYLVSAIIQARKPVTAGPDATRA